MVAELLSDLEWQEIRLEKRRKYRAHYTRIVAREDSGIEFCITCSKHSDGSCEIPHKFYNWCMDAIWPRNKKYFRCAGCGLAFYNNRTIWINGKQYCKTCAYELKH